MTMHTLSRLSALLLLVALPACVNVRASDHSTVATTAGWLRSELYFGLTRPGGLAITDAEFQHFAHTEIAPRFPDGFTLLDATGYWREGTTPKSERSRILVLLHPNTPITQTSLQEIARAYNRQFEQQAVLLSYSTAHVTFITDK